MRNARFFGTDRVSRGVAKVGHRRGNFGNVTDRISIQGAPDENCFTTSSSGRNGGKMLTVFEVKKGDSG
jgi:hypothetical protein